VKYLHNHLMSLRPLYVYSERQFLSADDEVMVWHTLFVFHLIM